MKSLFIKLTAGIILSLAFLSIEAAEPRLMVLPDRNWCVKNHFCQIIEKQGKTRYIEQYEKALAENSELKNVIIQINGLFVNLGFPLESAEDNISGNDEEEDEEEFMESEESGAGITKTSYDILMNKFKPDITIKLGWEVNEMGFNQSITYRLEAVDSYSNKSVASVIGTGPVMKCNVPISVMLEQSVNDKMPAFTEQIRSYFNTLQSEGREISLRVKIWENAGFSLSTEFGGKELGDIIKEWLSDNTINHKFTRVNATPNMVRYRQIRIPLKNSIGEEYDATEFVQNLRDYLSSRYGIKSANRTSGLGSGVIVLGSK